VNRFICAIAIVFSASGASAQEIDYQFRVLFHHQSAEKDKADGWTVWAIAPDVTKTHPLKTLFVGGWAHEKWEAKDRFMWVNVMAGTFLNSDGSRDPVGNVRLVMKRPHADLYAEGMYSFASKRKLASVALTTPLGRRKIGVGAESDLIWKPLPSGLNGNAFGFGPRFVLPITGAISLATVYQHGFRGGSFVRQYFVVNF